ncbi:transmembrane protease serine 3 isoform X2 [Carassius auratus]|uniref:Transmembrane protease serine 3 isoform X2 n=1 Tax=Carassius auratus TaxID=7957 RepID=A0A6P6MHB5_CARAU|nr:transmembrane protease serine 3-like isoform X2 [Carassius auratus]
MRGESRVMLRPRQQERRSGPFQKEEAVRRGYDQPLLWAVHAGITDQPLSGSGALSVEKIIYHANYRPREMHYNIALVKIKLPLSFNDQVAPICLPSYGESFEDGQMCLISGWGATVDGGEASVSIHTARVPLLSSRVCCGLGLTPWNICAGFSEGGAGTCQVQHLCIIITKSYNSHYSNSQSLVEPLVFCLQGDNGGPLACQGSGWTLVGAASWAESCGQKNKPGIYTSTSKAFAWIQQQMEKEEQQQH